MMARALVALTTCARCAARRPGLRAGAQEGAAHGLGPGAADPQPVSTRTRRTSAIWAINYDLLVNFSPKDLGPTPGIAESWTSRRQEDGHLPALRGAQVVRRQADHVEGRQVQPRDVRPQQPAVPELRREHHARSMTPDAEHGDHQDQAARRAHRGGLFVHILPEHIWGKQSGQALSARQAASRRSSAAAPTSSASRPRPHHPDGPQPQLPRREAGVRRDPVDQVRQRRRGRARAHAR